MMSRTGEEGKVPPSQLDEDGNLTVIEVECKSRTSITQTLEDLMKKLEKLKTENKKLKAKGKKIKHTSPQAKMATPHTKRKSPRRGRKEETSTISLPITLCILITITCLIQHHILPYLLVKLSVLMGRTITNGSIT
jgi:hypothetical protein